MPCPRQRNPVLSVLGILDCLRLRSLVLVGPRRLPAVAINQSLPSALRVSFRTLVVHPVIAVGVVTLHLGLLQEATQLIVRLAPEVVKAEYRGVEFFSLPRFGMGQSTPATSLKYLNSKLTHPIQTNEL